MDNKYLSRKYRLTKAVIILATAAFVIPPVISMLFLKEPFVILTGAEWGSIISATLLFFSAADVAEKHVTKSALLSKQEVETEKQ